MCQFIHQIYAMLKMFSALFAHPERFLLFVASDERVQRRAIAAASIQRIRAVSPANCDGFGQFCMYFGQEMLDDCGPECR